MVPTTRTTLPTCGRYQEVDSYGVPGSVNDQIANARVARSRGTQGHSASRCGRAFRAARSPTSQLTHTAIGVSSRKMIINIHCPPAGGEPGVFNAEVPTTYRVTISVGM